MLPIDVPVASAANQTHERTNHMQNGIQEWRTLHPNHLEMKHHDAQKSDAADGEELQHHLTHASAKGSSGKGDVHVEDHQHHELRTIQQCIHARKHVGHEDKRNHLRMQATAKHAVMPKTIHVELGVDQ